MKPQEYTELSVQPCNSEEEVEAKALLLPKEIQETLPEDYCWGFVYSGKEKIGALMWGKDEKYPESIGLGHWLGETAKNPVQNLYVAVENSKTKDEGIITEKVYGSASIYIG